MLDKDLGWNMLGILYLILILCAWLSVQKMCWKSLLIFSFFTPFHNGLTNKIFKNRNIENKPHDWRITNSQKQWRDKVYWLIDIQLMSKSPSISRSHLHCIVSCLFSSELCCNIALLWLSITTPTLAHPLSLQPSFLCLLVLTNDRAGSCSRSIKNKISLLKCQYFIFAEVREKCMAVFDRALLGDISRGEWFILYAILYSGKAPKHFLLCCCRA